VQVAVLLVAADDRAFGYRHPIPTDRGVARYVMGVVVGRRWGLHASCTRCVHFGALPGELATRHRAVATVDATMLYGTRPGATSGEVFVAAMAAYADAGYPDEWRRHHQGGATGYQSRTWRAMPGGRETVSADQAFAWNPSIAGTKSEDTVLCTEAGPEVLTASPEWPVTPVALEGNAIPRPDILVL
jgi:Xaa-Pro aminopeptidase